MHRASHAGAKRLVNSVLDYLKGMETLATMSNDRTARYHFEECWSLVWRAYYGGYSLAVHHAPLVEHVSRDTVPASKPAWMIAKYQRPTRKVIARTVERIETGKGLPPLLVPYDLLECGHKLQGNEAHGAAPPARHRRCGQCVPARSEASEGETKRRRRLA